MKEMIELTKQRLLPWTLLMFFGFCVGKQITHLNIISDCQVLGMFRVAEQGFDCRVMNRLK